MINIDKKIFGILLLFLLPIAYTFSFDDLFSLFAGDSVAQQVQLENGNTGSTINVEMQMNQQADSSNHTNSSSNASETGSPTLSQFIGEKSEFELTNEDILAALLSDSVFQVKYRGVILLNGQDTRSITLFKDGNDYKIIFDVLGDSATITDNWDGKPVKDLSKIHFVHLDKLILEFKDRESALNWYKLFISENSGENGIRNYLNFGTNGCSVEKNEYNYDVMICHVNMDSDFEFLKVTNLFY